MADPTFSAPRRNQRLLKRAEDLADKERELAAKEAIESAKHDGLTDMGNLRLDRIHRGAAASHAVAQRVHEDSADLHQRLADLLRRDLVSGPLDLTVPD